MSVSGCQSKAHLHYCCSSCTFNDRVELERSRKAPDKTRQEAARQVHPSEATGPVLEPNVLCVLCCQQEFLLSMEAMVVCRKPVDCPLRVGVELLPPSEGSCSSILGAISVRHGEEGAEPEGKALDLEVHPYSNPHLRS